MITASPYAMTEIKLFQHAMPCAFVARPYAFPGPARAKGTAHTGIL